MATYATDTGGGGNYDPVPEGSHIAVCDMFVDLGMQDSRFGAKHKIYLRWQIPNLTVEYEKDGVKTVAPMTIGATYTLSLAEKSNLRPMLQAWRGKAFTADELKKFDVTTVLGAPCLITVTHEPKDGGGVYANVGTVAKLPPGVPAPALNGETLLYDADNLDNFDKLRPWLQDKIKNAVKPNDLPEQRGELVAAGGVGFDDDLDDDVPFITANPALERRVA